MKNRLMDYLRKIIDSVGYLPRKKWKIATDFLANESLYSNSFYLMSSTFIMGIAGFFFWSICARLFTTEQVGLATALISVTSLITGISMFGFDIGIIRFLPKAKNPQALINTAFTIVAIIALFISLGYLMGIHHFSPALGFIGNNKLYSIAFIIIVMLSAINSVSDSVFIAKRDSKIILGYNSASSVTKLILPFAAASLGALGIYISAMGGMAVALLFTFIMLYKRHNYTFRPEIKSTAAKTIFVFSFKNFIANFINGLPTTLMPLLVLNRIGIHQVAYYYIAMMLTTMVYTIPSSITRSFFAEGVHRESEIRQLVIKAARMIFICLLPPVIVTVVFGKYVLLAFGKDFSNEAFMLLRLLSLTSLFIAINSIGSSILYIKGKLRVITILSIIHASIIITPLILLPAISLATIGWVWIGAHAFLAALTIITIKTMYLARK